MDLQNLLTRGFSTARLCQGGSETAQCPKWLANRAQQVLLAKMRELYMSTVGVDADENLSEQGRARKKAELAKAALASIEETLGTVRTALASKRETARKRLAEAGRPEGQSDIDRLARIMEIQGTRQLLLGLGGQELLGELIRSSREGDTVTFDAITGLPAFILRNKGIARETVEAARRELFNRVDPLAVSATETAEQMSTLVDQNMAEAARAIREHCGIVEERRVRIST